MSRGGQGRHLPAFILLYLAKEKAHGLRLVNRMNEDMPQMNIDGPAVYRTLAELEKQGAVRFDWDTEQPGAARKCYEITLEGKALLALYEADIRIRKNYLEMFLEVYKSIEKEEVKTK